MSGATSRCDGHSSTQLTESSSTRMLLDRTLTIQHICRQLDCLAAQLERVADDGIAAVAQQDGRRAC